MRICKIENCYNKHRSGGWCEMHYARWKRTGNPEIKGKSGRSPKLFCKLENCNLPHASKGYCEKHYRRFKKHGDPK